MKLAAAWFLIFLFAITVPTKIWASLGQQGSSAKSDCDKMQGTLSQNLEATVFTCVAENYTVVQEVGAGNKIAKISWSGKATPPLALLAKNFKAELEPAQMQTKQQSHRHGKFESANLRLHRAGTANLHYGSIELKTSSGN